MVRLRWTLALIFIGVPILVTVSAFRVRLAHERSDSQKHCASCDVNELNLDQKQSKLSNRHLYEGLKKVVHEKLKSDGKLSADDLSYLHGLSDDKKLSSNIQVKTTKPDASDGEHIDKLKENSKTLHSDGLKVIKSTFKSDNYIDQDDNDNIVTPAKVKTQILNEALDTNDDEIDIDDEDDSDSDGDVDNENDDEKIIENDESDEDDDEIVIQITKVPPKVKYDPIPPIKHPLPKSEQSIDVKDRKKESVLHSKIENLSKETLESKLKDKKSIVEIKNELPKKTTKEAEIKESIARKIKDQKTKKETDTVSKESTSDELEKIKVKSHLEAGKLQSHIISKAEAVLDIKKVDKVVEKRSSEPLQRVTKDVKVKNKIKTDQIKPLTDASHRKILLQSEFEDFYGFFPTFAPNFSRVHNPECRRHGQILLRQLRGTKLWALNMLDSSAKIPSGLLQGNGIQLGDFDQCLSTRARVQLETGSIVKVQGKYCLATMDVRAEHQDLEVAIDLLQGRNLIKGRVSDPGHFVPRFSTLSWGVCVPSPCHPDDVEAMIKDSTIRYEKLGISFNIEVDEVDCHIQSKGNWWDEWMELPTLLTLCFYGVVLCVVVIATCQDLLSEKSNGDDTDENKEDNVGDKTNKQDGFISAFSLTRTVKKLIAPVGSEEISSIHGLRAIATIALIIAHKFLPIAHTPYANRVKVAEVVSSAAWSWCRVGWVFTDCFLLLSGALTAYRTSEKTSAFNKLGSKYLRLTPAMLAVIWFYAFIWDHVTVGPMWGGLVTKNADICRERWWWNLFYLQNYFGLESMCAPQTHQLALDMQLSIIGSFIVWAIHSNMVGSALFMPIIHLFAAYSRYTMFRDHRLTMIAYHGVSVSQLYRTGRMSYTSILHRSTSYLIGISLGLALRTPAQHSKFVIFIGWVVSTGLWGVVLWAGFDSGYFNYQYNVTFAAQYAALAPIAIGLAFAWLLYAAHNGYSETLSSLLSSRPMLLISRLSYALYLTQFIIFLTNAATIRTSTEFTLLSVVDFQEIAAIFLSAVLLTLTLVIPMQSLPNVLFGRKKNNEEKELHNGTSDINKEENESDLQEKPSIRKPLLAHRELLEEIPEAEVEYETQRETQSLEEILEEDDNMDEEREDEDLEIIEEEEEPEGGEENFWAHQENGRDRDLDEWEWTNGNRGGAQHYRYSR
ncbi:O-acyltransferase like protein-like [Pieris napi]|uniref:O-acyltransferase like protein-like n=1 Tax=Pieris napi TaxID=78633 RepID=UPI001FBAD4E7|nr:O-acyltransferase like protein-like [Pieris napi]